MKTILAILIVSLSLPAAAFELSAELESGAVDTVYNDVRIPGNGGSSISLTDLGDPGLQPYYRITAGWTYGNHSVGGLYAPLSLTYRGTLNQDLVFRGETFAAGSRASVLFRFDSYRVHYRYRFFHTESFSASGGITGKIRDAEIRVKGSAGTVSKKNTGFVPLLSFRLRYQPTAFLAFTLDGDALAAPQGRAEDVLLSVSWILNDHAELYTGYRILEGGADNDEVYTFSMFQYIAFGAAVNF